MLFKEVVGQPEVKNKLLAYGRSEKIPHALMFIGPEGNGNLPLALAFAQYIFCENKGEEDSCGICSACIKNKKFVHPDLHFTFPVILKKSGEAPISNDYISEWRGALAANPYLSVNDWLQAIEAENRQGNITVRECHEIIRNVNMKTFESVYKVQIIWMAEFLKESGNTLLKAIEEPPINTIFLLVAENTETVLSTLLSRTQLIKINAIDDDYVKNALLQNFELDENTASRISRISEGNYNAALKYAGGEQNAFDELLIRWWSCCLSMAGRNNAANVLHLMEVIEVFSKLGRENQKLFFKYALFFLSECSAILFKGMSKKLDGDELRFAQQLVSKLNAEQLENLSVLLTQLHYYIERNANPKSLFLSNSFRIASLLRAETLVAH